ncbi:hypothetical protein Jiend_02980 [Micromonospora endophytica]|uniref:hypothetical protein n=1 Tax=Micromonospora endophytica TaxID=515350 RepID=UPI001BB3BAEA|nr:hypothetical protein [Micromonospora endophytica]BCJ56876.1 hypothetical protein Jiend_02980 [Micromonospora endophytica]
MSSSRGGRWRGEDGRELAGHVLARLTTGRSLDDLQLGSHEGRVDLRGFTLEPPKTGVTVTSLRRAAAALMV